MSFPKFLKSLLIKTNTLHFSRQLYNSYFDLYWHRINKLGAKKCCNICGSSFFRFIPYQGGKKNIFLSELKIIGSDIQNFSCPFCGANDRTRHLVLFFDRMDFWKIFENKKILHIAPEYPLYNKLKKLKLQAYILGDLNPNKYNMIAGIRKIDLTGLPFSDHSFDIVIANHVLEHIPNYLKAINEIHRVLNNGGLAIIQTPFSSLLYYSFEDPNINTAELRLKYYGEKDHYRVFGLEFFHNLENNGFIVVVMKSSDYITMQESKKYGVNPYEDLILAKKK